MSARKKAPEPWHPVVVDESTTAAIKALATGTASEGQQRVAWESILLDFCGIRDLSFRPESDRVTAFAEGRRHVGLQLAKTAQIRFKPKAAEAPSPHTVPVGPEPQG